MIDDAKFIRWVGLLGQIVQQIIPIDVNIDCLFDSLSRREVQCAVSGIFCSNRHELFLLTHKILSQIEQSGLSDDYVFHESISEHVKDDALMKMACIQPIQTNQHLMELRGISLSVVPPRYKCPITLTIITDPVFIRGRPNQFYERDALLRQLSLNVSCDPVTREHIQLQDIIPAPESLKVEMAQFLLQERQHRPLRKNGSSFFHFEGRGTPVEGSPVEDVLLLDELCDISSRATGPTPLPAEADFKH